MRPRLGEVVLGALVMLGLVACLTIARAAAGTWPSPPAWWRHEAACITWHESGDRVHDTRSGTYRGEFQFDYAAWREVGGSGDPAAASDAEQSYRAWLLYLRYGWRPWPNTSRLCGLA